MQEQEGDNEPAHHARRPMNAFLIFCKRHRSVVREKYPNLENRSITKILGEWWANLDREEKSCYTNLAKQYKDAFFNANPDFKWYKLPAPPLRTLSSRPRETISEPLDGEIEKTNNNSTKLDLNKSSNDVIPDDSKPLSMFTPGKLADEAQMGGLSSLLATKTETPTPNPYYSPPSFSYRAISTPKEERPNVTESAKQGLSREESIRELQNALSETTRMFEEDFYDDKGALYYYEISNDQLTNQDVIDQIVDKRYSKDGEYAYHRNYSDDEKSSKSGRSCKGKRYQEFMAVGGLIVNKRQKRDCNDKTPEDDYSASCSWDHSSSRSEESTVADDSKQNSSNNDLSNEIDTNNDFIELPDAENNINKTFKAADFDLDAKIRALPSLSLEKFQQKKRDNKRKKKSITSKPKELDNIDDNKYLSTSNMGPEKRETFENARQSAIGSQKRKPRKISITRLEINSLVSNPSCNVLHKISPEIKFATEAPATAVHNMEICRQPLHDVDLFALATLAEVAANTSKIEDTSRIEVMTAKSNDCPSTV